MKMPRTCAAKRSEFCAMGDLVGMAVGVGVMVAVGARVAAAVGGDVGVGGAVHEINTSSAIVKSARQVGSMMISFGSKDVLVLRSIRAFSTF